MEKSNEIMSSNIKKYLELKNIDRRELANKLGTSYSAICEWIKGRNYPRIKYIEKMSEIFGISPNDLISEETNIDDTKLSVDDMMILSVAHDKRTARRLAAYAMALKQQIDLEDSIND